MWLLKLPPLEREQVNAIPSSRGCFLSCFLLLPKDLFPNVCLLGVTLHGSGGFCLPAAAEACGDGAVAAFCCLVMPNPDLFFPPESHSRKNTGK